MRYRPALLVSVENSCQVGGVTTLYTIDGDTPATYAHLSSSGFAVVAPDFTVKGLGAGSLSLSTGPGQSVINRGYCLGSPYGNHRGKTSHVHQWRRALHSLLQFVNTCFETYITSSARTFAYGHPRRPV